jgi:transposase
MRNGIMSGSWWSGSREAEGMDVGDAGVTRRRWKVERLFAWMHSFRRLVTRWEYHATNFLGMVQLGCMLMLLRRL